MNLYNHIRLETENGERFTKLVPSKDIPGLYLDGNGNVVFVELETGKEPERKETLSSGIESMEV
jgi:hypothetical protein